MDKNAAFHGIVNYRRAPRWLAALAVASLLLAALASSAVARGPVGRDGRIHACYRVKGKPKGAMRVVRSARAHCRRGERKVSWSIASMPGPAGQNGQNGQGQVGQSGAAGSAGTTSKEATLQTEVAGLTLKVESLEGVLEGVGHESLTNALSAVGGLSNGELTEAVGLAPVVETLCTQNEELGEQINLISGVVEGLGLSPALEAIGLLQIPALPADLPPLGC